MLINGTNLATLGRGFKAVFNQGLGEGPASQYEQFSMIVNSTTSVEDYGWFGDFPGFREWVGDRVVNELMGHDYSIKNKPFEMTIGVDRDKIEDDNVGIYSPMFREMGIRTKHHPNELLFALLKLGFGSPCYDGQYFFDTDHPVLDANGSMTSVANTDGGTGKPWFLVDLSRGLKPMVFQRRRPYTFTAMDAPTDEAVFMNKKFRYGVDARGNVGFGLWQLAWGSKQPLTTANYKIGTTALGELKGDFGKHLAVMPTHLVVPPSLKEEGLEILKAERNSNGATNVWKNDAELLVCPWLA